MGQKERQERQEKEREKWECFFDQERQDSRIVAIFALYPPIPFLLSCVRLPLPSIPFLLSYVKLLLPSI